MMKSGRRRHHHVAQGEEKPCRECKVLFKPMSKYNVYCRACQDKIFGRTPSQVRGGVPR